MASIVIRQLQDKDKERLRLRAFRHGRSMEMEAREILHAALSARSEVHTNLFAAIRRHVEPLGGIELNIPRRDPLPRPVDFGS